MRVSKFSVRIIAITLLAVSLTAFAVNTLSLKEYRALYLQTSMQNLDALTDNIAELLLPHVSTDTDVPGIATTLLQLDRHESTLFASVFDKSEQEVFRYVNPSKRHDKLSDSTVNTAQQDNATYLSDGLIISNKYIGDISYKVGRLLVIQDPELSLEKSENTYLKKVIPTLLALGALVGFIAFSMQKRVLQKLNLVTSFVSGIKSSENNVERLNIGGNDEIGLLARGINEYLDTIRIYEHRIKRQLSDLEASKVNLENIANYDSLTGLPNRKLLHEILQLSLAQERRRNADLSILYFDLDHFKHVNDTLGHDVGDQLLVEVGKRISKIIREGDIIARLGGDEFVVLLLSYHDEENEPGEVERMAAERLTEALKAPFQLDKWEVATSASIGIASARHADYNAELLMRNADIAMYQAKQQIRGGYAYFEDEMHRRMLRRHEIANSISRAIKEKQLYVVYQPKLNKQAAVIGFEALLRWNHPVLGAITPIEFIDVAEKTGKVTELSSFVISSVIEDLHQLTALFNTPISIAINLSAHDLKNNQFMQQTLQKLKQLPHCESSIEFEITESAYLDNFDVVNRFVQDVHLAGSKVALDDFGTGYSSLSYLTKLSIDLLKIDRSFINNMVNTDADKIIVETIIQLAKTLNMAICAEGVETSQQFEMLKQFGCDFYQGYYFYRPMPLEQVAENFCRSKRQLN
jgi:diguanylate cyclase